MKTRPVGAELLLADERTDRHEANSRFSFCKRALKLVFIIDYSVVEK
jgi:hypothetical protein